MACLRNETECAGTHMYVVTNHGDAERHFDGTTHDGTHLGDVRGFFAVKSILDESCQAERSLVAVKNLHRSVRCLLAQRHHDQHHCSEYQC
jgi:hypothetical protein